MCLSNPVIPELFARATIQRYSRFPCSYSVNTFAPGEDEVVLDGRDLSTAVELRLASKLTPRSRRQVFPYGFFCSAMLNCALQLTAASAHAAPPPPACAASHQKPP